MRRWRMWFRQQIASVCFKTDIRPRVVSYLRITSQASSVSVRGSQQRSPTQNINHLYLIFKNQNTNSRLPSASGDRGRRVPLKSRDGRSDNSSMQSAALHNKQKTQQTNIILQKEHNNTSCEVFLCISEHKHLNAWNMSNMSNKKGFQTNKDTVPSFV